VFTPGMADPLSAATFTLAAGEERRGVDLRMRFEPSALIEGAIEGPNEAARSARVGLWRRGPVQALNTGRQWPGTTGGRVSSGAVSPGRYSLIAEVAARGDQPAMWAVADVVAVGGETTTVTLRLQPAPSVTGRLVFDATSLAPPKELSRVSLLVRSTGPAGPNATTAIDPSGSFTVSGVFPGPYVVSASVPASAMPGAPAGARWTMRSVVVDGQDVTDRVFDVPPAGASGVIVTFTDRVSELTGTITGPSGAPATDYFVVVLPEDRAYWLPQTRRILSTRSDGSGRYVFRGLPAGAYRIALTTDLVPRDLQDPAALERLLKQSAAVTIGDGERTEFNLRAGG
jgi:hypothetical protein